MEFHQPVLLTETLNILDLKKGDVVLDCTLGHGGHTQAFLEKGAIVYGVDQDPTNLEVVSSRISSSNFHPIHGNFSNLDSIVKDLPTKPVSVFFDLGLNSFQQKSTGRGFSFNDSESLDMRLDPNSSEITAEFIVNTYDFLKLNSLLSKTVQEKLSKPIAIAIIKSRQHNPIKSGTRLASIIEEVYQQHHLKTTTNPATKTFLALRILVNQEFENIKQTLDQTLKLPTGTKVIWISFHSGEDRLIKNFIRINHLETLTKKPITPTFEETKKNPLSRSSVLRSYKIN